MSRNKMLAWPFVAGFVVGVALLTRLPSVRAFVKWVYYAIARQNEVTRLNNLVDPLFRDQEKYKLEILKMSIAAAVFLVSDDILKLTFAGAISTLTIYGILPEAEQLLIPPIVLFKQENLLIDDARIVVQVTNHLLNHFLLLLGISLANVMYFVLLLVLCICCLPYRLLCCCLENCPQMPRRATNQVAAEDIPDSDVETTVPDAMDDDFVAGDNDDYDYDDNCDDHPDDYPDDIYGESAGLVSRLRGVSIFGSVELPTVSHVPQVLRSRDDLQELLSSEMSRKHNRFCYIRCLDPVDRVLFQAKMIQLIRETCHDRNQQETIITQGCLKMRTWRRIMKQIPTVATYKLWRKAYWGENSGRTIVHHTRTRFHVLV
jgi:hypothetical protein